MADHSLSQKQNMNLSNKQNKPENLDAGQLALRCAQFFMSLGQSCLSFYEQYKQEKERKTKQIKKQQKNKQRQAKKPEVDGEDLNEEMKKKLPKKPLTAYIIYFQQKKPNFVQKYPGLNLSDLTKLIAKQWKQIDNNQRKPYLAQAHEDRKRYENEMKQFKAKYGTVANNEEADGSSEGTPVGQPQEDQQNANKSQKMENQNQNQEEIQAQREAEGSVEDGEPQIDQIDQENQPLNDKQEKNDEEYQKQQ